MQNFLNFGIPQTIKNDSAFYSPQGEARVSAIDARDIAAVAATVLTESGHEGKCYELTGGESLSPDEIAGRFTAALGREIRYVCISEAAADEAMARAGTPPWLIALLSALNRVGKAGYLAAIKPDTEMILRRPPVTFAQFIQDHLSAFRS